MKTRIMRLDVYPLLGNELVNKFHEERFLINSPLLGYATILTIEKMFSMWSAPCPALSNRTANTSTRIGVIYGVGAEGL
jgi:hypothetical protein